MGVEHDLTLATSCFQDLLCYNDAQFLNNLYISDFLYLSLNKMDFYIIPMQRVEGNISMNFTVMMNLIVTMYQMWAPDTRQTVKVGKDNVCSCQM